MIIAKHFRDDKLVIAIRAKNFRPGSNGGDFDLAAANGTLNNFFSSRFQCLLSV